MANPCSQQQQQEAPPLPPLPPAVEQLIGRICVEQSQQQLGVDARQRLAAVGEEAAIGILQKIQRSTITHSFDGYVRFLASKQGNYCSSPSRSPTLSSASPSKSHSSSLLENRSPARTLTPILFNSQVDRESQSLTPIQPTAGKPDMSPQLEALGELEFRKAFLILSYIGGTPLEELISVDQVQRLKHLPMYKFEEEVWASLGSRCGYIKANERAKSIHWDSGKTHIYHCHVASNGSYRFKGPYLTPKRNFLQRALGDDNILMVKFEEEGMGERNLAGTSPDSYTTYSRIARDGIFVGLRRYQFFVYKDGGKEEKKKDSTSSPVKCYFVRMESKAYIDREEYIFSHRTVREARSVFMHAESLSNLSKYMIRLSLILSKTVNMEVNLSEVSIETIPDVPCKDEDGNDVYDKDGKTCIHTDGTGFISEDLAFKCPRNLYKGQGTYADVVETALCLKESEEKSTEMRSSEAHRGLPPLLIQFRLFNNGSAVKGTLLVNRKLPRKTIQVRPSMIKVETNPKLLGAATKSSFEIVGTSNQPKRAYLSRNLIALLSYGGVPQEVFLELLSKALEDARGFLSNRRAALRVALNYGEKGDFDVVQMICAGIPLRESYLRHRLLQLINNERNSLKAGKIFVPESYYLMGTTDPTPTRVLKRDEVCVILDNGQLSGKVLVYRNPGLHFGDIHVLKATYVEEMEDYVGNAKYGIFFSSRGPRSVADEMAGGDYDGDMYFVSQNSQLLETFRQTEPWTSASSPSTNDSPNRKPCEFSDDELEDELFRLFLATRFKPSYTVGMAADSWQAMMDRLLTLGDDCTVEKDFLKENMCKLIEIYYEALDAPKRSGKKIEIPDDLKAELFPHYMEKKNSTYNSTSILGKIYDTVKSYEEDDTSTIQVEKLQCFDSEIPESCSQKWGKLYCEYRQEMSAACNTKKFNDRRDDAAEEVIKKYKQILYEAAEFDESKRAEDDIFNDALAIYHVSYNYASLKNEAAKCGFAWRAAGSALCKLYLKRQNEQPRTLFTSVAAMRDIYG